MVRSEVSVNWEGILGKVKSEERLRAKDARKSSQMIIFLAERW